MDKKELLEQFISDYRQFFDFNEMKDLKEKLGIFLKENKDLSNDEFFKKYKEEFITKELIDQAISRTYLQRISSDIRIIKIIVVIYLIASIIYGIYYWVVVAGLE